MLGKSGMLGSAFSAFFAGRKDLELLAFDSSGLDVTDHLALAAKFREFKPEIVINCTAYTAVDEAENAWREAFKINAEAVREMAVLCRELGATLIHFSTDYVFDGKKTGGYEENDQPGPINIYGESKAAGEKSIIENAGRYYLIRTSWLFGRNSQAAGAQSKNFVDTMLKLGENAMKMGTGLSVVNDQFGSPTYTRDLCDAVIQHFVQPQLNGEKLPDFGIYHLTNSGTCSWFEFAGKIFELKSMEVSLKPISSGEFPSRAKRPKCSILLNTRIATMRLWQEALEDYLRRD